MNDSATNETKVAAPRLITAARGALFLALGAPAVVLPGFIFPFVTIRNVGFRILVELALALVLALGVGRVKLLWASSDRLLRWFLGYIAVTGVAAMFGVSPWRSVFGDFERMGGLWAWLHLFLFYVLLRILMTENAWLLFFRIVLFVGDFVVLWGASALLPEQIRNPQFGMTLGAGSTIGNPGLLAPYLMFVLAFAIHLAFTDRSKLWRIFYALSGAAALFGIVLSLNRSTAIGCAAGSVAAVAVYCVASDSAKRRRVALLASALILIALAAFATYSLRTSAGMRKDLSHKWASTVTTGGNSLRMLEWGAAARGFLDRPIFGYGMENNQVSSAAHFDPRLYAIPGGVGIFDRTHNAWLETLVSGGIVCTIFLLGIWVSLAKYIREAVRQKKLSAAEGALWTGLAVGYATYLTFWFFDLHAAMLWVAMMAYIATRLHGRLPLAAAAESSPSQRRMLVGVEMLIFLSAYLHGFVPLRAAYDMDTAAAAPSIEARFSAFFRVMDSAAPQSFHTMEIYTRWMTQTLPVFLVSRSDPVRYAEMDLALKRGFLESRKNIDRNPRDPRVYVEQARLSLIGAAFYGNPAYSRGAVKTLRVALKISPLRSDNRVLLANTYLTLHDTTRALVELDSARRLAPLFGGTYYSFARIALARGEVEAARAFLMQSLARNYLSNSEIYWQVITRLEDANRYPAAAKFAEAYLSRRYGDLGGWGDSVTQYFPAFSEGDKRVASNLPMAYLIGGDTANAIRVARAIARGWAETAPAEKAFEAAIARGTVLRLSSTRMMFTPGAPKVN